MIKKEEVFPIGKIIKPHGVVGQMTFRFTTDVFDTEDADFFILEMEGILVPFFIEEYRFCGADTALLKLEGVDSSDRARELSGHTLYLPNIYADKVEQEEMTLLHFVGFTLVDVNTGVVGEIIGVDDTTENVLFIVRRGEGELLVPAGDELVTQIDPESRHIYMQLPDGLTDL